MYDGITAQTNNSLSARVVGDVMGQFHPHGGHRDLRHSLVRLVQDWNLRYPLVWGQGNFGSPAMTWLQLRAIPSARWPLAMEMVRDIDEETVDFQDNYDGRTQERQSCPRSRTCWSMAPSVVAVEWRPTSRRITRARDFCGRTVRAF